MDIRPTVLAIVVGGAPAPGVNGVISSVVLEALNNNLSVIGIKDGFRWVKHGATKEVHRFEGKEVTTLFSQGGCFLGTSRETITPSDVDNTLRALEHLRVRYLVVIGGSESAAVASLLTAAASQHKMELSIVLVPKSIFNDLPLPENSKTFGFETAREVGVKIVQNLRADARATYRWYVVVTMGQKAGHLALGIGKAAASTLTLIPEEYKDKKVTFKDICDTVEASIVKRAALDKNYGVAVITEGLVDLMDQKEVESLFGDVDTGHQELARAIVVELGKRFSKTMPLNLVARNLGNELRSADPNASDTDLSRDLGYGAVTLLLENGNNCMVTIKNGALHSVPLSELVDKNKTSLRLVDTNSLYYKVARKYMIRLLKSDFTNVSFVMKACKLTGLTQEELLNKYAHVSELF